MSMIRETLGRRLLLGSSLVILVISAGCIRARNPVGGCPYQEVSLSEQDSTPWGSAVRDDLEQLEGPYPGTLEWLDGDDAIEVPKAGEAIDVEVAFAFESSSVVLREYIHEGGRVAACEPDEVLIGAEVSFVRSTDGEIELRFPLEVRRTTDSPQYFGEAFVSPPASLSAGLEPVTDFDSQAVIGRLWWDPDGADLQAILTYAGQTESGQSGQGAIRDIATFGVTR